MDDNGWDASAAAWLRQMDARAGPKAARAHEEVGDWGRLYVLDAPMLARVRAAAPRTALDVGCGEGRFCRMMAAEGIDVSGIDRTAALVRAARARDPAGRYAQADAVALPFDDNTFDLVVSYVSLIDIDDHAAAIGEMARVVRPGGRILVANLAPHASALDPAVIERGEAGVRFTVRDWLCERSVVAQWCGIRIRNWHRPLSSYITAFLGKRLRLTHFDEPPPLGARPELAKTYRDLPWFLLMEWAK